MEADDSKCGWCNHAHCHECIEEELFQAVIHDSIEQIKSEVLSCTACQALVKFRNKIAFSYGTGSNGIMIVGTAPSQSGGNLTGMPMSEGKSRSGKLVFDILAESQLVPMECYITNILFCATPGNREPLFSEINSCVTYKRREIRVLKPKLVIMLGRVPMWCLIGPSFKRGDVVLDSNGFTRLVGFFHPSYILRQESAKVEADYKAKVKEMIEKYGRQEQENGPHNTQWPLGI